MAFFRATHLCVNSFANDPDLIMTSSSKDLLPLLLLVLATLVLNSEGRSVYTNTHTQDVTIRLNFRYNLIFHSPESRRQATVVRSVRVQGGGGHHHRAEALTGGHQDLSREGLVSTLCSGLASLCGKRFFVPSEYCGPGSGGGSNSGSINRNSRCEKGWFKIGESCFRADPKSVSGVLFGGGFSLPSFILLL